MTQGVSWSTVPSSKRDNLRECGSLNILLVLCPLVWESEQVSLCREQSQGNGTNSPRRVRYLLKELTVECGKDEHTNINYLQWSNP